MPAMRVVPRAGEVTTEMLDATPDTELERSIAVPWLLNATATPERAATTGATNGAV